MKRVKTKLLLLSSCGVGLITPLIAMSCQNEDYEKELNQAHKSITFDVVKKEDIFANKVTKNMILSNLNQSKFKLEILATIPNLDKLDINYQITHLKNTKLVIKDTYVITGFKKEEDKPIDKPNPDEAENKLLIYQIGVQQKYLKTRRDSLQELHKKLPLYNEINWNLLKADASENKLEQNKQLKANLDALESKLNKLLAAKQPTTNNNLIKDLINQIDQAIAKYNNPKLFDLKNTVLAYNKDQNSAINLDQLVLEWQNQLQNIIIDILKSSLESLYQELQQEFKANNLNYQKNLVSEFNLKAEKLLEINIQNVQTDKLELAIQEFKLLKQDFVTAISLFNEQFKALQAQSNKLKSKANGFLTELNKDTKYNDLAQKVNQWSAAIDLTKSELTNLDLVTNYLIKAQQQLELFKQEKEKLDKEADKVEEDNQNKPVVPDDNQTNKPNEQPNPDNTQKPGNDNSNNETNPKPDDKPNVGDTNQPDIEKPKPDTKPDDNTQVIKNWGNVPLPHKLDDQITKDDLIQMWDTMVSKRMTGDMNFGDRNISTNRVFDAYIEWITENWVKYPYFSPNSDLFTTSVKSNFITEPDVPEGAVTIPHSTYIPNDENHINKTTWFVSTIVMNNVYGEEWLTPGPSLDNLNRFVQNGLALIKDDMSDWDKVFALYNYITQYFYYGTRGATFVSVINNATGVCKDYATAYAYLLNQAGLKAFPWETGHGKGGGVGHMVAYIYLPVDQNNNPTAFSSKRMWFDSDPTQASSTGGPGKNYPKSFSTTTIRNIVTIPATSQFEPNGQDRIRYTFNLFEGVPFNKLWLDNSIMYGPDKFAPSKTTMLGNALINDSTLSAYEFISNYYYYDNKWYSLWISLKGSNKEIAIKSQNFFNKNATKDADIYQYIPAHLMEKIENAARRFFKDFSNSWNENAAQLFGYQDKLIFVGASSQSSNAQLSFIIYDITTHQTAEYPIPNSVGKTVQNYYVDYQNKRLIFKFRDTDNQSFDFPTNNLLFNPGSGIQNNNLYNEFISLHVKTLENKLQFTQIGNQPYQITQAKYDEINSELTSLKNSITVNSSESEINAAILKVQELTKKYNDAIYENANQLILIKDLNRIDSVSESIYKNYGYNFKIHAINSPSQIIKPNESLFYELYFKANNTSDWVKVLTAQGTSQLRINSKIVPNANGEFKIRILPRKEATEYIETSTLKLSVEPDQTWVELPQIPEVRVNDFYSSNLDENGNYSNKPVNLSFDFQTINNSYNSFDLEFYYVNLDTKAKTLVKELQNVNGSINYRFDPISEINNSNHGLYFAKITLHNNQTNNNLIFYTPKTLLFSRSDLNNFDFQAWANIAKIN
ncbi:hypothetical protein [Mycoplasma hafezii]|uniref:transglutaminase-like domain-containing protein n=1 Tax=Mycoplasma hafezii TaxID=525886 RepID=UPI003CF234AD